jgi:peptidoglycan/xylan/chitin deacetylase (PgdA/CDA1 family)
MELDRKAFLASAALMLLGPSPDALASSKPITHLPSVKTRRFAWTIDDGVSNSAVRTYLKLAEETNNHLTFFVTSCYSSWKNNASQIRDLLAQGKIQLANHTHSHRNLIDSNDQVVKSQLLGCHNFLLDEFGLDARPYFRPTYGYWDQRVLSLASQMGYTVPVMWRGTLGDTAHISGQQLLDLANRWIVNGQIIVDHANSVKTNYELERITQMIRQRGLKSVTLKEAFGPNYR